MGRGHLLVTSCLLQCLVIQQTRGSVIGFESSPTAILEGLTSRLTLKCSLTDTSAGIVGRRDVSRTSDNMASVTSLVIMKDGRDIASVSPTLAAHVMDGSTNVQVSGSVSGSSGQRGFLQLTITDPTVNQTGEFMCEANAVSVSGHIVTFSTGLEVVSTTPTLNDLVTYVRDVERKNEELEKKNEELEKTVSDLKNRSDTMVSFNARLGKVTAYQANQVIVFDVVMENTGNDYNSANGQFVCEIPGYYDISLGCLSEPNYVLHVDVFLNYNFFISIYGPRDTTHATATNSAPVKLAKGDIVKAVTREATSLKEYFCEFSGHLIKMT